MVSVAINATPAPKPFSNSVRKTSSLIENLVREKTKCRRDWQKKTIPAISSSIKYANQALTKALENMFINEMEDVTNCLNLQLKGKYSLWRSCKTIKPPTNCNPPLRNSEGKWARSDEEKALVFAKHLESVFQPNPRTSNFELPIIAEQRPVSNVRFPCTLVAKVIKELDANKAPGDDLITPSMVIHLPTVAVKFLTDLFNAALRLQHFPQKWKTSKIKMIAKEGKDTSNSLSYRPISLLHVVSKNFE